MKKREDINLYEKKITLGRDASGSLVRKSVYAKTKAELEKKIFEARQEWLQTAPKIEGEQITLVAYCKRWLATEKSDKAIRTRAMYEHMIEWYIIPSFDGILISEITQTDLLEFLQGFADRPNTSVKLKLMLRQVFRSAEEEKIVVPGKIKIDKLPTYKKKPKEKRALTQEEKDALFSADLTDKERSFVLTLYYTGLRREEVLALTSEAFDFKNKTVKVSQVVVDDHFKPTIIQAAKSNKSLRTVPLPDNYIKLCRGYLSATDGILWTQERFAGKPMTDASFKKFWSNLKRKLAEIAPSAAELTPHMFRHNYATMLYYSNISLKKAADLLGHADTTMIMRVYAHLDEQKENTAEKLNAMFS